MPEVKISVWSMLEMWIAIKTLSPDVLAALITVLVLSWSMPEMPIVTKTKPNQKQQQQQQQKHSIVCCTYRVDYVVHLSVKHSRTIHISVWSILELSIYQYEAF